MRHRCGLALIIGAVVAWGLAVACGGEASPEERGRAAAARIDVSFQKATDVKINPYGGFAYYKVKVAVTNRDGVEHEVRLRTTMRRTDGAILEVATRPDCSEEKHFNCNLHAAPKTTTEGALYLYFLPFIDLAALDEGQMAELLQPAEILSWQAIVDGVEGKVHELAGR
ncbi:MAG: hypothetical protein Q8O40_10615 [Chloroflexota bacterium]|nr:hypothetical protein [Chloroflexota bacterium]